MDNPPLNPQRTTTKDPVVVLGATGYVGGRLVTKLLEAGYTVRAVGRSLQRLQGRSWSEHPQVSLHGVDVMEGASLEQVLHGAGTCYYLVHSMNGQHSNFVEADRNAALTFIEAARKAGVGHVIYLGGLGKEDKTLSTHLKSRGEVAALLRSTEVPVTVLRAAMIIGSGSASFEILRYLVERLPVMVTPRWVSVPNQPIAIRDVLGYLVGCLTSEAVKGKTWDIGGPDVLTYRELMDTYAEVAQGRKPWIIPVPVFTPRLSSYWIHLVTPVPAYIARPLAEGLKNPVVCEDGNVIQQHIPQDLLGVRDAIERALERVEANAVETHWLDTPRNIPDEWRQPGDAPWAGGTMYFDHRKLRIKGSPEAVWKPIVRIGGETGWYYGYWLWKLRGFMDLLFGGQGFARGRKHPEFLQPGDFLDCWRVLAVETNKRLLLKAEMKVPGRAYLEFYISTEGLQDPGYVEVHQLARFYPTGLLGILYWWAVTPLHHFVFQGMLMGLAQASGLHCDAHPQLVNENTVSLDK